MRSIMKYIIILFFLFFLPNCNQNGHSTSINVEASHGIGLKHIKQRGKIRIVTDYSSTDYFVYRGCPMGFQYELLQALSEHLGVKLELMVNNDITDAFDDLEKGKCDLLAMNLAVTNDRTKYFDYTLPHSESRQVLIQRNTNRKSKSGVLSKEPLLIRNQLDLAKKTVYVQKGSSYEEQLINLSNEIGDTINIVALDNLKDEYFIAQVAKGEIDYTVADENIAMVNKIYYPNLDISTAISFPQKLAWALRKDSKNLQRDINKWITEFRKSNRYKYLYRKYYKNNISVKIVQSKYYALKSGQISDFDEIIKTKSKLIEWDWRLLASLIYQESSFNPKAESWAGAFGLMQLMPGTACLYKVDTLSTPEENIEAGVRYLGYLNRKLNKTLKDSTDKLQFILASYNAGLGHILDARRLALKNGKNPDKWLDNVDYYILNKSKPEFYNDPVVKYGYCRGKEPFNYVTDILERYNHYQNIVMN